MREIKFRAWDKIEKKMWVPAIYEGVPYASTGLGSFVRMDGELLDPIMQFTGLLDKEGVEIYESDLLKNVTGRIGVVVWHNPTASFDTTFVREARSSFESSSYGFENNKWANHIEVIGNIYENPELLDKGEGVS